MVVPMSVAFMDEFRLLLQKPVKPFEDWRSKACRIDFDDALVAVPGVDAGTKVAARFHHQRRKCAYVQTEGLEEHRVRALYAARAHHHGEAGYTDGR